MSKIFLIDSTHFILETSVMKERKKDREKLKMDQRKYQAEKELTKTMNLLKQGNFRLSV
jgi:hypothetical protein